MTLYTFPEYFPVAKEMNSNRSLVHYQPAIACSKLTIETLKQGVKMFKVSNKGNRTRPLAYFTSCSSVSIVNFEQVNAGCILRT